MSECGKDIGGIWLPHSRGGIDHFAVRCNRTDAHPPEFCRFFDRRSGNVIVRVDAPQQSVDEKGCLRHA